ncbi:FAD-dependent monooxygenase [Actinoplanes sp. HUAS TT8]|uniref:FAD-dependent monooxygenase n=1 Tax=Actinoplanes sp. HUAS TT8 TaxID=3447453 RepID=UPI003F51EC73
MTSNVVVVGGGIGGLAGALALSRAGQQVIVLEQTSHFGEVGAGMQIAPNCTRILDAWGLLDEVMSLGVRPEKIVMKDAVDGSVLSSLDLHDVERRYGFPYLVIHRSDLHGVLLRACERAGVSLVTDVTVTGYSTSGVGAAALHGGGSYAGDVVIAADGLRSTARRRFSEDEPVSSAYVAYRGAVPIDRVAAMDVHLKDVVVFVGPRCHLVQYPLRHGEMFNQVAVFESPGAVLGPDELDAAFQGTCAQVRAGLPLMWRDRWWRMYDREPIMNWVDGRLALAGDAAHAPLQYLAQGAVMAIEDAWVLGAHDGDWDATLAAYNAVRPEHCRRVMTTARAWGEFWHHDGAKREWRNSVLRGRDVYDYSYVDWLFGATALRPEQEPPMFPVA